VPTPPRSVIRSSSGRPPLLLERGDRRQDKPVSGRQGQPAPVLPVVPELPSLDPPEEIAEPEPALLHGLELGRGQPGPQAQDRLPARRLDHAANQASREPAGGPELADPKAGNGRFGHAAVGGAARPSGLGVEYRPGRPRQPRQNAHQGRRWPATGVWGPVWAHSARFAGSERVHDRVGAAVADRLERPLPARVRQATRPVRDREPAPEGARRDIFLAHPRPLQGAARLFDVPDISTRPS
jgi:hypothetical protein